MPHSRWLLVALVTGSSVMAAACGTSGYQYVEHEDLGVYAKVPDDWAMYDEQELFGLLSVIRGGGGVSLERELARTWYRGFDSSAEPSIQGTQMFSAPEPRGYVQIQSLLPAERESVSTSILRGMVTGADPVAAVEENPEGEVEVLSDEPVEFDGGYHGVHTVQMRTLGNGTAVIDQTVVLDASNSVMYMFVVGCSPGCYSETHADVIDTIVESWTIQEGGS